MVNRKLISFVSFVAAFALSAGSASADPSPAEQPAEPSAAADEAAADEPNAERAAARALFDEGRRLSDEGRFDEACKKLEAAREIIDGIGIMYQLASCYESAGRTTDAWTLFRQVAARAAASGDGDREAEARKRADALAPALAKQRVEEKAPEKRPPSRALPPELFAPTEEDYVPREALTGIAVGLLAAGVVSTAVGFAVYAAGVKDVDEADDLCGGDHKVCDNDEAQALAADGTDLQRTGLPLGIAGSTGIVVGLITLAVTASMQPQEQPLILAAGTHGGSATYRMRW